MDDRVYTITTLGADAPRTGEPGDRRAAGEARTAAHRSLLERAIDRALAIQRPVVIAHVRSIRRGHPTASPQQIVRILERRYLAAVTAGGAAVGATAVIPGIGTGVTLALSGVETAGFLETTALFAQSVAEVHGIAIENPDRARSLVMALMLGSDGADLVRQFAAQATGVGTARSAYWGELLANTVPKALTSTLADQLRRAFVSQFAVRGGAGFIGKALPYGVGAAVGGIGNHVLGRRVLAQSRSAFGTAPETLAPELDPRATDGLVANVGTGLRRAGLAVGTAVGETTTRLARHVASAGASASDRTRRAIGRRPRDDGRDDEAVGGDRSVGGPEAGERPTTGDTPR